VLFHKKGEAADPANYRPIALHLTIYKLWTSIITQVLQDYAEEVGMLNRAQEGFRKFRNCARQLQLLTRTIEDAKSSRRNLFLLKVDFSSAFKSIDHTRLFAVMRKLGYPEDAVKVVVDLYTNATTSITTSAGQSDTVRIQRGTIQGDTLSPFLFLLVMEPPLRWLEVGNRGYRCGIMPATVQLVLNALG